MENTADIPKPARHHPDLNDPGDAPKPTPEPRAPKPAQSPDGGQVSRGKSGGLLDLLEKPIEWVIRICGWSSIIGLAAIFLFIFKEAAPMVPKLDWVAFFTSPRWIPNPAEGNEPSFGALALLVGTFITTFIALILAVPIGLGAAVYISEFAKGKVKETLKVIIELLAAIPSIVWGFIGLMVLGPIIKDVFTAPIQPVWGVFFRVGLGLMMGIGATILGGRFVWSKVKGTPRHIIAWVVVLGSVAAMYFGLAPLHARFEPFVSGSLSDFWGHVMVKLHLATSETGAAQGTNLLTGGIILALMSVPLIVSLSEDALRAVPDSFREAALALGANGWETVRRVLFPAARNGLLAASMLGMGRAIGETMAVLLATGHNNRIPQALTDPVRTITATIAAEMGETVHGSDHYRVLFILGIVLFVITCGINVVSDLIIKGVKRANKA